MATMRFIPLLQNAYKQLHKIRKKHLEEARRPDAPSTILQYHPTKLHDIKHRSQRVISHNTPKRLLADENKTPAGLAMRRQPLLSV
jgi:hypothetical protein